MKHGSGPLFSLGAVAAGLPNAQAPMFVALRELLHWHDAFSWRSLQCCAEVTGADASLDLWRHHSTYRRRRKWEDVWVFDYGSMEFIENPDL